MLRYRTFRNVLKYRLNQLLATPIYKIYSNKGYFFLFSLNFFNFLNWVHVSNQLFFSMIFVLSYVISTHFLWYKLLWILKFAEQHEAIVLPCKIWSSLINSLTFLKVLRFENFEIIYFSASSSTSSYVLQITLRTKKWNK